jgi:hypothetical protein
MKPFNIFIISVMTTAFVSSSAVAQQNSLKEQLVGTWTLVSYDSTGADGTRRQLSSSNGRGTTR